MSRRTIPATIAALLFAAALAIAQTTPGQGARPAATAPSTRPTTTGAKPIPTGQLLDSLLKPAAATGQPIQPIQEGPTVDATTGKAAIAPGAPQLNLVREGTLVTDRTGRLTRSADGLTAEFSFDSDGKALKDPPMIILPNLKLMQMESAVQGSSRDLRFRITGVVTEYKGRNYVLLEKVVVVPDVVQQF